MVNYQRVRFVLGAILGALMALSLTIASAQDATVTVTQSSVGGSGVTATATLTAVGNQTMITVSARGLMPGSANENEVHFGTCANTGAIAFTLSPLIGSASGTATVSTTINATLASLQDGNHEMHIHQTSAAGAVLSCGNIPMAAAATATAVVATATPVTTPVATPTTTPVSLPVTGGIPLPTLPVAALGGALFSLGYYLRRRR